MTSRVKNIFKEFYELSYKDSPVTTTVLLKDSCISSIDNIILRRQSSGNLICSLLNGTSIFIPIVWVNMFSSLNVYCGDRIFWGETKTLDTGDKVDKLCFLMTYLLYLLDSLGTRDFEKDILDTIERIGAVGTEDFRHWLKDKYDLDFPCLEYRSLDGIIEI